MEVTKTVYQTAESAVGFLSKQIELGRDSFLTASNSLATQILPGSIRILQLNLPGDCWHFQWSLRK